MTTDIITTHADVLDLSADDFASFDCLITDPPYSAHVHANAASIGSGGRGSQERDLGFAPLTPELLGAIANAANNVKRWSCIFSDFEGTHLWREACDLAEYIRLVPWIRWSQPQLSGDRPCTGAEAVNIFHAQRLGKRGGVSPLKKHWNGPGSLTHFSRRCMRGKEKHPTEKPIDLMLDLVSYFSDPGDVVFDPCAGAGTTALACRLLGRSCVSFEIDEAWAAKAERRATGRLSPRDEERAKEWCVTVSEEVDTVPLPRADDGSDVRTWERGQRRLADVGRVVEEL
jgi:site-specific DNA-methyltransferase (adenine-specific)